MSKLLRHIFLVALIASCGSDNIDADIVNGYTYVGSLSSGMIIKEEFVLHNVVAYENNEKYIVAVRFYSPQINTKFAALILNDREDTKCEYWVIVHDKDVVYGPLTRERYKSRYKEAYSLANRLRPFHSHLDRKCFEFEFEE